MGKLSKKLVVYLDQNFLSEMAKSASDHNVNPLFREIYELLHQGFVEEKTTVPASWFHKLESSFDTRLKNEIVSYQNYLGQTQLHHPHEIHIFQLGRAAKEFLGEKVEPITYNIAYNDNPDKRTQRLNVVVDSHLERFNYRGDKQITTQRLEQLRKSMTAKKVPFKKQLEYEFTESSKSFIKYDANTVNWIFNKQAERLQEFSVSTHYKSIPRLEISTNFFAKLLTDFNNRAFKPSDPIDIDIISTYLPYVDVFATDTFMANLIRGFGYDKKYNTLVFDSSQSGLGIFKNYLIDFLPKQIPINRPSGSIFIIPDKGIKEKAFEFFKHLCLQNLGRGKREQWIDIHCFDDGKMPTYYDKRIKIPIPFYGLQDVDVIEVRSDMPYEERLSFCKKNCKSDKFVVIDSYKKLPDNFQETLAEYMASGKNLILGYKIYDMKI